MLGGAFLCFEGFEKLVHKFLHREEDQKRKGQLREALKNPETDLRAIEKDKIKGAIRTDFILSAEIIAITLGTVTTQTIGMQFMVLAVVAIMITVLCTAWWQGSSSWTTAVSTSVSRTTPCSRSWAQVFYGWPPI